MAKAKKASSIISRITPGTTIGAFPERLGSLGATLVESVVQRDRYFDDTKCGLQSADKGLRIRQQISAGVERVTLTYKGPRGESKFKSRSEYEGEIADHDNMVGILEGLGYEMSLGLEKRRDVWAIDGCHVCLDEVAMLGYFVEVEAGGESQIEAVLEKLGLAGLEHIPDGYASLIGKMIEEEGLDSRYICFEGDGK